MSDDYHSPKDLVSRLPLVAEEDAADVINADSNSNGNRDFNPSYGGGDSNNNKGNNNLGRFPSFASSSFTTASSLGSSSRVSTFYFTKLVLISLLLYMLYHALLHFQFKKQEIRTRIITIGAN